MKSGWFWIGLVVGILLAASIMIVLDLVFDDEEDGVSIIADLDYGPLIDPEDFVEGIDNPFLPYEPGSRWVYEGRTDEGLERIEVLVMNEPRTVMGVECTVVRDTEYLDGSVIEDTYDWFAQDEHGNVWYFGEDTSEIEDGKIVGTEGSWEAGKDGAFPGIVMMADPIPGFTYRQEYYEGEAEDIGSIVSTEEEVSVDLGDFQECLKTFEWTPLEPGAKEYKYYAPDVGLVLETSFDGSVRIELTSFQ